MTFIDKDKFLKIISQTPDVCGDCLETFEYELDNFPGITVIKDDKGRIHVYGCLGKFDS